jgi:hypothetical protein
MTIIQAKHYLQTKYVTSCLESILYVKNIVQIFSSPKKYLMDVVVSKLYLHEMLHMQLHSNKQYIFCSTMADKKLNTLSTSAFDLI